MLSKQHNVNLMMNNPLRPNQPTIPSSLGKGAPIDIHPVVMDKNATLKQTLYNLEDMIRSVHVDLQKSKDELNAAKVEKDSLEKELTDRSTDVRENLQNKALSVEVLLKDNLASQKTESVKL